MSYEYAWNTYSATYFEVAVFSVKDQQYGTPKRFNNRAQADQEVIFMRKLGYGSAKSTPDNASEIHVRQVSVQQVRIL